MLFNYTKSIFVLLENYLEQGKTLSKLILIGKAEDVHSEQFLSSIINFLNYSNKTVMEMIITVNSCCLL